MSKIEERLVSPSENGTAGVAGDDGGSLSRRSFVGGAAATGVGALLLERSATAATRSPYRGLPNARRVERRGAELADLEVVECAALLQAGKVSSRELTAACMERIAERDGEVKAWKNIYPELAQRAARRADRRLARGDAPPLCGIPIGIKDIIAIEGQPLTAGSNVLAGNVAKGDSTVWSLLSAAGMVPLGHTETFEFASSGSDTSLGGDPIPGSVFAPTTNPWDTSRTPGGSSAGSGAALAARMVPAALGTDTGGSLRSPAHYCGISTIKATYGRVSIYGVIPNAWNWDHVGPMARSARDCALLLATMAGADPNDPPTLALPPPPDRYPLRARRGTRPLAGTRLGVPRRLVELEADVAQVYERALGQLRRLGARLVPLDLPFDIDALDGLADNEFLAFHSQFYPERADDYQPGNAAALSEITEKATSAQALLDASRARTAYIAQWRGLLADNRLDAVASPVRTVVATPLSERVPGGGPYRGAFNANGFPATVFPAGLGRRSKLPVGFQLAAGPGEEGVLLKLAATYQERYPYYQQQPEAYR